MRALIAVTLFPIALTGQQFDRLLDGFLPAPGPGRYGWHASSADWDGDGDLDLAVVSMLNDRVELLENDGEGRFVPAQTLLMTQSVASIAWADVDGDGDPDLFVGRYAHPNGASNLLLRNDGTGGFTDVTASQWPNAPDSGTQLLPVDLDGDQDLDLVVCNSTSNWITWAPQQNRLYDNDGAGTFTDITNAMPHPPGWHGRVVARDFDGDTFVDLVFGVAMPSSVSSLPPWPSPLRLFRNTGAATFVEVPGPPASHRPYATDLDAFDADGDGDQDLLLVDGQAGLYLNDGLGQFTPAVGLPSPPPPYGTVACEPCDIEGDGDLDLVFVDNYPSNLFAGGVPPRLWENLGGGTFVDRSTALPQLTLGSVRAGSALAFDADGDGDSDLWFADAPRDALCWNDGLGTLTSLEAFDYAGGRADFLQLADLDGDGKDDLIAVYYQGSSPAAVRWHRSAARGAFAEQFATVLPVVVNSVPRALAVADLDGDGDLDVYSANGQVPGSSQDRLALNDGTGGFTEVTATALPADQQDDQATAHGDVDGDGDMDLVIGSAGSNRLYLNQGNAVFLDASAGRLPVDQARASGIALVDTDLDGDLDCLVANDGSRAALYHNDGLGTFTDVSAAATPATPWNARAMAVGDIDGDGDADAVLGGWLMPITVLRNDGGVFVAAPSQTPTTQWLVAGLHLGDADDDGDLDLFFVTGQYSVGPVDVLVNDGAGTFALQPMVPVPTYAPRNPGLGDVDGDGDLDFAGMRNLQRQLQEVLQPRIGRHGELRLHARARGTAPAVAVLLLASAALAVPQPLGSAGHLRVDPSVAFVHSTWILPAPGGSATVRYPVPNAAGLLGVSMWGQGAFHDGGAGSEWRLGNLVEVAVRL